jgi:hypothetical protein
LTLAQIDHHADAIEKLEVQGIMAFAERVLPQRHRFSSAWRRVRVPRKNGEPHFRELEPDWRMAQACELASERRLSSTYAADGQI